MTHWEISDSRFALYEGLIALAWADSELTTSERIVLEDIFTRHRCLSSEQRERLHADIQHPRSLSDIWARMTDPQDRARFIDLADVVFKADGHICEQETQIYAAKLARHLGTLDVAAVTRHLDALREEQMLANKKEAEAFRDYARDFGLFGFIKRLITRDDDAQKDVG